MTLEPNRDQIEMFADAVLRRRGNEGYISLRSFLPDNKLFKLRTVKLKGTSFKFLIDAAQDLARRAANNPIPVVFSPPLAVFNGKEGWRASEEDLSKGLVISVECDQRPEEARQKLQDILGEATAIVRSGGQWVDPDDDGLPQDKLHLHWRLNAPATGDALGKLKRARFLATAIVDGDVSNVPTVHCLRWPGSWHRKGAPRLCEVVTVNPDREIDLDEALAALKAAAPDLQTTTEAHRPGEPQAAVERIAAALAVIPNNENWDGWSNIGMATWRATGGSAAGLLAFDAWSKKSPKYDARNTTLKWAGYFKSPPTHIGAGTIFHLADQAEPNWRQKPEPEPPEPDDKLLPYVDLSLDLKPREWLVPERIPMFNVTLLSGEGAIGKSLLAMQLSAATALGREWIEVRAAQGPVLYVSCEEDDDEIRRRMEAVAVHLDATRQDLIAHSLHVLSFAGRDAIMAQPDRAGILKTTPVFDRIRRDAAQLRPRLIVLDTVADTFGGDEIKRGQTRQFITMLRGLAIDAGSAVVVVAHPSLEGIRSGSGLSGSTGWHNGPRARMYFRANDDDGDNADPTLRLLEIMKNNYGPPTAVIRVRWKDGVFVTVDPRQQELDLGTGQIATDKLFVTLLRRLTGEGRNVTDKTGTSYAPAIFAKQPEAKSAKVTNKAFAESMERLFAAKKIRVLSEGPISKQRTKIVEVTAPSTDPFPPPSTDVPPPSTDASTTPPYNPPPGGSGAVGGGSAPPAATGQESPAASEVEKLDEEPPYRVLGSAPGERCIRCGKGGDVKLIARGGEAGPWHEDWVRRSLEARADPPVKVPVDPEPDPDALVVSMPFLITQATKRRLRAIGYSDAEIADITPQRALDILAEKEPEPEEN